jgi:GTPase SAR1 family protein
MDTAGQERYNSLSESYYKQADCCLLMYDITSRDSFEKIEDYYIGNIKSNCRWTQVDNLAIKLQFQSCKF